MLMMCRLVTTERFKHSTGPAGEQCSIYPNIPDDDFRVDADQVKLVSFVRNVGVFVDVHMSMRSHVASHVHLILLRRVSV